MKSKNKFLALALWLFLGVFGAHRFYLGSRKVGLVYLALIVIGVVLEDSGSSDASDNVFLILTLLWLYDLFVVLRWKNVAAVEAESTQSLKAAVKMEPARNAEVPASESSTRGFEFEENRVHRIVVTRHEEPVVNMVYAEVGTDDDYEVFGAFSGVDAGGGLFHQTDDGIFFHDEAELFASQFSPGNEARICAELERMRAQFEAYNDDGDFVGLSSEGLAFMNSAQEDENGVAEAYSPRAAEDFIIDCQDSWNLNYYKEEDYGMNQISEGPAYPEDGITDTLDGLNSEVWDRGYYHETSDGTWYEVYVTDTIKGYFHDMSLDHEDFEHLNNYACINLDHYQDDNQITFFVPDGEEEYTLGELTEMFI